MDLPFPVAWLVRRARNAKSPKERHDTAYFAWEASVRLAVAARPPADASGLAMPSVGHFVGALVLGEDLLDASALLAAYATLAEVGLGRRPGAKAITAKALLEPLAAYRNQVLGHGSTRSGEFYERAAGALLGGLDAAWAAGVFWPKNGRLVYVDAVEIDADGSRRARVLALSGLAAAVEGAGGGAARPPSAPEGVLPRRLYLRTGDRYDPLHPWIVYQEVELRERALFFNGRGRSAQYLDYASGEALKGKALAEAFPAIEGDLATLFSGAGAGAGTGTGPTEEKADPALFGDYRILGKLGQGGMGIVYLARQEGLGRLVALKMLPLDAAQDPVAVARFKREVAALSRADHPNVVKILASGEAQGTPYYAMELVEGADLAQVAEALSTADDFDAAVSTASGRVRAAKAEAFAHVPDLRAAGAGAGAAELSAGRPKDRARRIAALFRDAARAVHHLHEVGVIHRDLKPGNLMVTAEDHRVVVMDLGLAALGDASRSITKDKSALLGTLRYMPPEQLQRNLVALDRRADVYSLGATLYELLTDKKFFDGDSEARLVEQVLREEPVAPRKANPRLPSDLATIVEKATRKDPRLRYDSAEALAQDLDAFLALREHRDLVMSVAFSPDGRRVASGSLDRTIRLWDVEAGKALGVLRGHQSFVTSVAFSPDGRRLASGSYDKTIRVWDVETGEELLSLRGHDDAVQSVAFSPDGRRLASGSNDKTIRLWDVETGKELLALHGHAYSVNEVAFSLDGCRLASGSSDTTIRLWDVETGKKLLELRGHVEPVSSVAFSPDGRRLASGGSDKTIRLWEVDTGKELLILRGHDDGVRGVAFSPDGRRLASGSYDKTIRIWDVETGKELHALRGHQRTVMSVAFSPDGRRLASGSHDTTVRLLNLAAVERFQTASPADLLSEAELSTGLRVIGLDVVPIPQNRLMPVEGK